MTNQQALSAVDYAKFIPLFYHADISVCQSLIQACYDGGVRAIEYTNRGEKALSNFTALKQHFSSRHPDLALGIGSVINAEQAQSFFLAGADFIVAPIADKETGKFCRSKNIAWMPGCFTLSEIMRSVKMGAELVKIFPANVLGPEFVRGILGPVPALKIMPTGGVDTSKENLQSWFGAGVYCVGMGSNLISKKIIESGDYAALAAQVSEVIAVIKSITKPN